MFLSDQEIESYVRQNSLIIQPFDQRFLRPSSYVIRLDKLFNFFPEPPTEELDFSDLRSLREEMIVREAKSVCASPGQFFLGRSLEKLSFPRNVGGIVSGLSHVGRMGILVAPSAFFVHPGFGETSPSQIVLELYSLCPSRIRLYAGMPICHLIFFCIETPQRGSRRPVALEDVLKGFLGSSYSEYDEYAEAIHEFQKE